MLARVALLAALCALAAAHSETAQAQAQPFYGGYYPFMGFNPLFYPLVWGQHNLTHHAAPQPQPQPEAQQDQQQQQQQPAAQQAYSPYMWQMHYWCMMSFMMGFPHPMCFAPPPQPPAPEPAPEPEQSVALPAEQGDVDQVPQSSLVGF